MGSRRVQNSFHYYRHWPNRERDEREKSNSLGSEKEQNSVQRLREFAFAYFRGRDAEVGNKRESPFLIEAKGEWMRGREKNRTRKDCDYPKYYEERIPILSGL